MRVPFQKPTAVFLAAALFAGCYNYVPIDPVVARPGAEVRARVNAAAGEALSDSLGLTETRLFDGTLVDHQSGDITLNVQVAPQGTIGSPKGVFKSITITRAQLVELESVKLDKVRTGLAIGIVATGVGLVTSLLRGTGSSPDGGSEQPATFNIGLLHFRF